MRETGRAKAMRFLLLLAVAGVLAGCDGRTAQPRETLTRYLDAVIEERHEDAYQQLSTVDKRLISLLVFSFEVHVGDSVSKAVRVGGSTFKVKKVRLSPDGKRAEATVVLTVPKRKVVEKAIDEERAKALRTARRNLGMVDADYGPGKRSKALDEETDRLLVETLLGMEYRRILDTERVETTFHLVREPAGWRVFLGWDGREKITLPILLGRVKVEF